MNIGCDSDGALAALLDYFLRHAQVFDQKTGKAESTEISFQPFDCRRQRLVYRGGNTVHLSEPYNGTVNEIDLRFPFVEHIHQHSRPM